MQKFVETDIEGQTLLHDRHKHIDGERAPDLGLHGVLTRAIEGFDPQVLFDPFEKGLNVPRTGQSGSVGLLVTKTLVIAGDPQNTAPPNRQRGAMLRAYDKATGKEVGAVYMPSPQSGTPMTYAVNGRQYIIVAISGGQYSGEYVAFRLPS